MPRFNGAHSTQCCGAHSFSGFGNDCDTDPNLINEAMVGAPVGRLGDITLNGDQVRRPRMMQRLADLGFVLDAHWINSVHGSHVYRFTRCDSRRPLLDGPIAGNWPGMVLTQDLTGDLPRIQQGAANAGVPRRGRDLFQVGDRVRVHEGGRNGRDFDIEGIVEDGRGGYLARMRDDRNGNAMFRISFNNLTLREGVERRNAAAQPAVRPQRHENARVPAALRDAPAAQAPGNPQVVGRYWHCVFRDGRRGAGYQTYAEANRNLGRRTRVDRFEILSDGTTRWVERVNN